MRATKPERFEVGDQIIHAADPAMMAVLARVRQLARENTPILISGESGVGKEVIARAIHALSPRASGPFIPANCGGLPTSLIESDLFGREHGVPGATDVKVGLVETANRGTLLLDEISELPLELQPRLIRLLDRREVGRAGGLDVRKVDARVVAVTNRDLPAELAAGRFRSDLYFRLTGATILIPALRDRSLDIPILAQDLLDEACENLGRAPKSVSPEARLALMRHPWPGNVRELKRVMNDAALALEATLEASSLLRLLHPPSVVVETPSPSSASHPRPGAAFTFTALDEELRQLEKLRMTQALDAAHGIVAHAARLLRVPRRTFVAKLKRHGIHRRRD